jgi:predicted nucleic acid-binding protein
LGEFYVTAVRKLKRAPWEAAQAARNLLGSFDTFTASRAALERALAEAAAGRFSYWDALLLASANEAGCRFCFSEDMADGVRLGGVEVVAPFGDGGLGARAMKVLAMRPNKPE